MITAAPCRVLFSAGVPSGPDEQRRVEGVYAAYASAKARSWAAENPGNQAIRAELVDAAFELAGPALPAAEAILDVGCGSGWWLERLAREPGVPARLCGLEILEDRVAAARARVPVAAIEKGDARSLPYAAGTFDVVTLFTTLSSLGSRGAVARALGEALRVLKPDGIVLVWEPRVPTPANRHTLYIRLDDLRQGLAPAGLEVRSITVLPPLARRLGRNVRVYPALAALAPLRTHRLVCARLAH